MGHSIEMRIGATELVVFNKEECVNTGEDCVGVGYVLSRILQVKIPISIRITHMR